MLYFDPLYFLFMAPALLIGLWAQLKVKRTVAHYAEVATRGGRTGAEVARSILRAHDIDDVSVEPVRGFLSDHYDSRHKVLRLSPDNYHGRSVTAAGVAAHEVGHAIQHAKRYWPLMFRQAVAPAAAFSSNFALIFILIGFLAGVAGLIYFGIAAFSVGVVFALITLPVEFDASRRAKKVLGEMGLVSGREGKGVAKVLNAAAMTYVAAAVSAIAMLLYFLLRAGLLARD
jgi:Zn-dependent membrane protease YugP